MVGPTIIHGDTVMASLANKTALVTGASRGIGRATAEALAKVGAHLIVHYGRSASGGGRTCGRNSRGRWICGCGAGGPLDAGRGRRARQAGSRDRRPAAGHLRVQCRRLEGRRDRGTHDRRLRQPVRHECPQSVLSREGVAAAVPRGVEHHRRLLAGLLVLHPAILGNRARRHSLPTQPRKERWKRW